MSTLTIVRTYWPAFDGVSDAVVNAIIADSAAEIGHAAREWGVLYGRAVAALTAHHLEMRARQTPGGGGGGAGGGTVAPGAAVSVKTGDLSVTYANAGDRISSGAGANSGDAIYAQTSGGQEYLRLRARLPRILVKTI